MTDRKQAFVGEDENAGFASPTHDLIAAAFLILLSLWIIVESLRLDVPGGWTTAPGLLPLLTAGSLCVMSLGLGWLAFERRGTKKEAGPAEDEILPGRALLLIGLIAVYLLSLQLISFEYALQLGGTRLLYGSFEVLTIIALTAVLSVFWQRALWACLAVSAVWTTALAAVFRYVFVIPLPG